MSRTCTYFLAPPSPYVYLGHDRFVEIARRHGVAIDLKPFDIGRVFAQSGGLPLPKRAPQRQAYRLVELERWREFLGLPLNLHPRFFPVAGDPAAKLIIAAKRRDADAALALSGDISRAIWAGEKDISDPDTLVALAQAAGFDGAALLQASKGEDVAADYARNTDDAIAAGVFGAPWYVFNGEPFWGQDRLDFLERAFARG
jgi:2-hydroxychromene-2-carboxylate isomerase